MTIADGLMIIAVLIGPVIAVRLTRYLDEQKEIRERKLSIFKTLMATRAYTLSAAHVEALNRIDLEFTSNDPKERAVIEAWTSYLDLLGEKNLSTEQWSLKRVELLVDLLQKMAVSLKYDFVKTQIKNGTYAPIAHGNLEEQQEAIRRGVIEVMEGKRSIPMFVTNDLNPKPSADKTKGQHELENA